MKAIATLFIIICLGAVGWASKGIWLRHHSPSGQLLLSGTAAPLASDRGLGAPSTSGSSLSAPSSSDAPSTSDKGFAVVELFTSEGCSSCPPADELVAKTQSESNSRPVYILAFHVDYWNHLGWKDVFSDAAWSKRQNQYAAWLHLSSVYTPQIVVNGRTEFVGSEEGKLRDALKSNLKSAPSTQLTLKEGQTSTGTINLQYQTEGVTGNTSLLLALVQKTGTTQVKRGENEGRTLSHVQIVRNLQTIVLENASAGNRDSAGGPMSGTAHIDLPAGLNRTDCEIIAFLQNNANGEIVAATKL